MKEEERSNPLLEEYKGLLQLQIKLDIAKMVRQHPHLQGDDLKRAYEKLANPATIDALVRDLAHEEVQDTLSRGHIPPAAMLALAGFKPNEAATN